MTRTGSARLKGLSKVADHATRKVKTIDVNATLQEAGKLMARFSIGSLLVTKGKEYVGLLTDTDLARIAAAQGLNPVTEPVGSIMSRAIVSIEGHRTVEEAQTFMKSRGIRHLAILEQGRIVGLITLSDVLRYYQALPTHLK